MSYPRYPSLALLLVTQSCGGGRPAAAPPCVASGEPSSAGSVAAPAATEAAPAPAAARGLTPLTEGVTVEIKNPLASQRASETISVRLADVQKLMPALQVAKVVVQDSSGALVLSQLVDSNGDEQPDELVFQTHLAPSESKTFLLGQATRSTPSHEQYKVYGRFVHERHDDFAWESDRAAHRMYGTALETYAKDPLTSSGVDVWVKRTPRLVINEWYQSDDYHRDNGDGGDFYSVGPSRGCGGLGIWDGKALHVSRNFTRSRVLANGPIRLIFELEYAPWSAGGVQVSETKRVTVDAGQHFDRFESTFTVKGKPSGLSVGVGIAKHDEIAYETDQQNAILRSWEPFSGDNGHLGCAVLATSGAATGFAETPTDRLLLLPLPTGAAVSYFVGVGWDKGRDVPDSAAWAALVNGRASSARSPVLVSLAVAPRARAAVRQ